MDNLTEIMAVYGLPSIFIIIVLEYACLPIASEIVLPLAGMLAMKMGTPLIVILGLSVIAGLIGSAICYLIGRCGQSFLEKLLGKFPKMASTFEKTCDWQRKYGKMAVMLGRLVPLFRTYISFASGLLKQNFIVFTVFSAIGITVWNALLISIGYYLGEMSDGLFPLIQNALIAAVVVLVVGYIVKHIIKKESKQS